MLEQMYPRKRADEKESIYGINSKPKFQYFSNTPAVLTIFIEMYNNVIFFPMVFVEIEVDSCHMGILIYLLRYHTVRVLGDKYANMCNRNYWLVCTWMFFLSNGGVLALAAHILSTVKIQQNYCFFSKEMGSPQSSVTWERQLSTCPVTSVFYRNFIKDCLIQTC